MFMLHEGDAHTEGKPRKTEGTRKQLRKDLATFQNTVVTEGYGRVYGRVYGSCFFSVVEYGYIAVFVRGSKVPLVARGRNLKIYMMSYMMGLMVFGGRHFRKKSGHQNRRPLQCYDQVVADC